MRNMLTITGQNRVLRGVPTPEHPTGLFVKPNGLQGLQSLGARRREALARAVSHGEHDVPVRLPARVITIDAWAVARSLEELGEKSLSVTGWGATGARFTLAVDHLGRDLTCAVRMLLADVEDAWQKRGLFYARGFQVQMIAADPRRYGQTSVIPAANTASVSHEGNFPAFPVIEIPAAPAAYSISSPAGAFSIVGATAGGTHRLDMRTGRVTRNGVWMPGVGRGQLWAVPEGQTWDHTLTVPGRVLIADTYI